MSDFLLNVWAKGDPNNNEDLLTKNIPISLWKLDGESKLIEPAIATHHIGVETAPIDFSAFTKADGNPFTMDSVLTQEGLRNHELMKHVGAELWKRLAVGNVQSELKKLVVEDCCVYLDLKTKTLEGLPWELLWFAELPLFSQEDFRWIIGSPNRTTAPGAKPPTDLAIPLRIMIVIGNRPTDLKLKADDELAIIERHVHDKNADALLKVMSRPSASAIEAVLTDFRPHVFHFIGHGALEVDEPVLHVWNIDTNQNDSFNVDKIRQVFRKSPPRLVLLNACSTATTTSSLADAFSDAGCTAVLAMMGEILSDSSLQLSNSIYKHIFAGMSIEKATAKARHELRNLGQATPPLSQHEVRSNWPLPRLRVNGKVAEILKISPTGPQLPERNKPRKDFVDRWDHRWQTLKTIDPRRSRLLVLYGAEESGKTELLKTLVAISSQQGAQVLVVNRAGKPSGTWQDLLGFIVGEAAELGFDTTALKAIDLQNRPSEKAIPEFLKALNDLVTEELILVVDGIGTWEPKTLTDCIFPLFCKPFVNPDENSKIRLMVTLREKPDDGIWGVLPLGWNPIGVGDFREADGEWERAVRQMKLYWEREIQNATNNDRAKVTKFADSVTPISKLAVDAGTLNLIRACAEKIIRKTGV